MTTQNESPKRLTVIESSLTPCPYNRLWLVQIPQDGWDRFECIVDDSRLRSPELLGPIEVPENGVEFVRKGSANYTAEQLQAAYDRAYADVRKEYAEDLPAMLGSLADKFNVAVEMTGYWIGRSDEAPALLVKALPYLPADLRLQTEKFLRRPPCKEPTP